MSLLFYVSMSVWVGLAILGVVTLKFDCPSSRLSVPKVCQNWNAGCVQSLYWPCVTSTQIRNMKYPDHTVTQPLSEKQAQLVERAVRTGKPIANQNYLATIREILAENKIQIRQSGHATGSSEVQHK